MSCLASHCSASVSRLIGRRPVRASSKSSGLTVMPEMPRRPLAAAAAAAAPSPGPAPGRRCVGRRSLPVACTGGKLGGWRAGGDCAEREVRGQGRCAGPLHNIAACIMLLVRGLPVACIILLIRGLVCCRRQSHMAPQDVDQAAWHGPGCIVWTRPDCAAKAPAGTLGCGLEV
eukprot:167876-Chlamydomonas_euryale.AAC.1